MEWLNIVQVVVLAMLSVANFALAYRMYQIQSDRNTAKLVITSDNVIEDDEHEAYALRVYNVGLVPAVGVDLLVDIEEWKGGKKLNTKFHEKCSAFHDNLVQLNSQDFREYELPTIEDRSCIFTAVVTCRNGAGDDARFVVMGADPDPVAFRHVRTRRKSAVRALKAGRKSKQMPVFIGANSLKDYNELFGNSEG